MLKKKGCIRLENTLILLGLTYKFEWRSGVISLKEGSSLRIHSVDTVTTVG